MWKRYLKNSVTEIRPYELGEDLSGITLSKEYPTQGDMICRDPNNPTDQWHITADFFKSSYVLETNDDN